MNPENPLIALAARRPVGLMMIASAVFVFGLISLARLPMDLMPEISYPTVTVRTSYPGAAPEDVEDRISRRLEERLSVVRGLRRISSSSRAESSDVIVECTWDTDMNNVVQEVREKLDQTVLPDGAEAPSILRYDPSLDPVLQIGIVGEIDLKALRLLAEEEVERRLETVRGVAAVRIRGGLEEEVRIEVDEELIRSRGITVAEVSRRLAEENLDRASGLLEEGDVAYVVRTRTEFANLEEIADIPIRREGNSITRLRDIARVLPAHKEQRVITWIDGRSAVKVEIYREAGANIVELAARVKARLFGTEKEQEEFERWQTFRGERFTGTLLKKDPDKQKADENQRKDESVAGQKGSKKDKESIPARPSYVAAHLDEGVELSILSDQSTFIESAIRDLYQTAALGGVLAIGVLYLFLARFSYTVVVALSIPFSVVATFAPMYLGGITLNIMSLGGLALGIGMLVDSSIVVLEAIFRRHEEGEGVLVAAVHGASEVGGAVFASTLTTVAVFFPIAFVEGIAGQVFRDQALTVVFALIASLVASLTLIPMLTARLGTGLREVGITPPHKKLPWARDLWQHPNSRVRRWSWVLVGVTLPYAILRFLVALLGRVAYALYLGAMTVVLAAGGLLAAGGARTFGRATKAFDRAYRRIEGSYLALLELALGNRRAVVAVAVGSLGLAALAALSIGSELIPEVAQGEFEVRVNYPVGTPIATTADRVRAFGRELNRLEDVASVATTIGVDPEEVRDAGDGEHSARFQLRLRRTRENPGRLEQRVLDQVREIFGGVTDFTLEVTRPALFTFKTPIEVEVRGHNLARLREIGRHVEVLLSELDSVKDVRSNIASGNPEYHLYPNREKMMRHDITSQQLADVVRRKNLGDVPTRYRQQDRRVDIRVQLQEGDRDSIDDLLAMVVQPRPGGGGWTLGELIHGWEVREGPSEIRRVGQERAAVISADLRGVDLGRVAEEIETKLWSELELPPEFTVEVVGQKREMERSMNSLIGALLLAVFLVYVVMASQFESLLQPFIILLTIPLAGVGVMGTLWITRTPVSVIAFIGMIMLAGIVVNNAIVLVDQVNRLRRGGRGIHAALVEAGRKRLRPILMTTLTTVLGMIPITGALATIPHGPAFDFLLGSGQGAEIRAPLAYTVIGGLLSSTLLTLVVIPVVYSLLVRDGPDLPSGPRPESQSP